MGPRVKPEDDEDVEVHNDLQAGRQAEPPSSSRHSFPNEQVGNRRYFRNFVMLGLDPGIHAVPTAKAGNGRT